jgi:hypothetical protein
MCNVIRSLRTRPAEPSDLFIYLSDDQEHGVDNDSTVYGWRRVIRYRVVHRGLRIRQCCCAGDAVDAVYGIREKARQACRSNMNSPILDLRSYQGFGRSVTASGDGLITNEISSPAVDQRAY